MESDRHDRLRLNVIDELRILEGLLVEFAYPTALTKVRSMMSVLTDAKSAGDDLYDRIAELERRLDVGTPAVPAAEPQRGALPPEVEAAVAIRHTGDIFAAQNTRTVAQAMLRQGATSEAVRDSILSEGVVID